MAAGFDVWHPARWLSRFQADSCSAKADANISSMVTRCPLEISTAFWYSFRNSGSVR